MRIHVNRGARLPLEGSIHLPEHLRNLYLAEAVRFGIVDGKIGQQARDALFKAFYLTCLMLKVDKMIVCARFPLHKLYFSLLFEDIFPAGNFIEMAHIGNIEHRLLMLQVNQVEPLWKKNNHFLYRYFFETNHPDINAVIDELRKFDFHEELIDVN